MSKCMAAFFTIETFIEIQHRMPSHQRPFCSPLSTYQCYPLPTWLAHQLHITNPLLFVLANYKIRQTHPVQAEIIRNEECAHLAHSSHIISSLTEHYHINTAKEAEQKQSLGW